MEERRRLDRFDLALPSTIEILDPKQVVIGTCFDCFTRDVSAGGAYFLTSDPLPTGTYVAVEMALKPESGRLPSALSQMKARGSVVRTEPAGMAVCFNGRCRLVPGP
jgi:hypothetical protein